MIPSLTAIILAFAWLLYESDWLRIRLPVGGVQLSVEVSAAPVLLLSERCYLTKAQEMMRLQWLNYRAHRNVSYQQFQIGNVTARLAADSPLLYTKWAELTKAARSKPKPVTAKSAPPRTYVERVRLGSHWEHADSRRYSVEDYKTIYHDSLVSKEWLEQHANDHADFVPHIEIAANGSRFTASHTTKKEIKQFITAHR